MKMGVTRQDRGQVGKKNPDLSKRFGCSLSSPVSRGALSPAPCWCPEEGGVSTSAEELKSLISPVMGSFPSKAIGLRMTPGEGGIFLPKTETYQGARQGEAGGR